MGMDDLAKGALVLIGVGMISKRFGAGLGLAELGTGVSTLVGAPGVGVGAGLSGVAGGIRDIAETFGDLGRGLAKLFEAVPGGFWGNGYKPGFPDAWPKDEIYVAPSPPLITVSGGSKATLAAGGGQNVTKPLVIPPDPYGRTKVLTPTGKIIPFDYADEYRQFKTNSSSVKYNIV